jgi:hypothetical protein
MYTPTYESALAKPLYKIMDEPIEIKELNNNTLSLKRYYTGYKITKINPNEIEYYDPNLKETVFTTKIETLLYNPTDKKPFPKKLVTFENIKPDKLPVTTDNPRWTLKWNEEEKSTIEQFFVIKENKIEKGDNKYNEVLEKLKIRRLKDETDANNKLFDDYSKKLELTGNETKYIFHIITDLDNDSITYLDSSTNLIINNNNNNVVYVFDTESKQPYKYTIYNLNLTRQTKIDYMRKYYVVTYTNLTNEDKPKIHARVFGDNGEGAKSIFNKYMFGGSKQQKSTKKHTYNKRKRQTKKHLKMNKRKSKKYY